MRKGRVIAVLSTTLCIGLGAGCRTQAKANAAIRSEQQDDRRWEQAEVPAAVAPTPRASVAARAGGGASLASTPSASASLGVARDLALAGSAPRDPVCRCLAVTYGRVDDPRFVWKGEAGPERTAIPDAMAIAITGDGVACRNNLAARRASVAAVGREGDDVVLTVESVSEGTPVMRGAIVPRPPAGAHLVVRGRAGAPYGAAAVQAAPCRIALR